MGGVKLSERFEAALVYAAQAHAAQRRKGSDVPYLAHLLAVAVIVLEYGGGEEEAIAALLHDAVEDQGGSVRRADIARRFGENVARIVDGCTDTDQSPKPPWRARKEAHLARLLQASPAVRLVSAADKLHNARSVLGDYRLLGEEVWQRFSGGREGTLWYYRAVAAALGSHGASPLIDELARTVEELERAAEGGKGE